MISLYINVCNKIILLNGESYTRGKLNGESYVRGKLNGESYARGKLNGESYVRGNSIRELASMLSSSSHARG
jgi:hypothetical protein